MQEEFEKIIYNKILEKAWQPLGTFDEHSPLVIKVSDVKEIIEQLAAECENGWIPCSERMPKEHESMFAKFKGTVKWKNYMFENTSDEVMLIGILFDGSHIKLNLAIIDCNQCQWQGLRRDKSPIDTDFVYDVCQSSRA